MSKIKVLNGKLFEGDYKGEYFYVKTIKKNGRQIKKGINFSDHIELNEKNLETIKNKLGNKISKNLETKINNLFKILKDNNLNSIKISIIKQGGDPYNNLFRDKAEDGYIDFFVDLIYYNNNIIQYGFCIPFGTHIDLKDINKNFSEFEFDFTLPNNNIPFLQDLGNQIVDFLVYYYFEKSF